MEALILRRARQHRSSRGEIFDTPDRTGGSNSSTPGVGSPLDAFGVNH